MDRTAIYVEARDPISRAGLIAQLRPRTEILVVDDPARAVVALVVADTVDEHTLRTLRRMQRDGRRPVLVAADFDEHGLAAAVEAGIAGLVRRQEATSERLTHAVCAAARGEGTVPPDLLGRLLDQVGRLQRQMLHPRGLSLTGLTHREIEILRLVAEGDDTAEIAAKLCYSQRTIKNALHDITSRLQLRNRSHAVAYALRQGLI
ncbi:helix-turn-helix transcriptional regulator [Nocardia barduliensis]|uniref:helix-turn-helix transcriptional regulator n=1 Tax=Nocardia barduliensis TaxID=2736643 RepID=UPI001571A64F|nr:response regulator transcription factor [Nocardia barduliensis]